MRRRRRQLLVVVISLLLQACAFEADYGGARFLCPEPGDRCPAGTSCVAGRCEVAPADADASPGPDGGPDAGPDTGIDARENDGCGQAIDLTVAASAAGGTTVTGDTTGYANDVTPSPPTCTNILEQGPDAIYKIGVVAGDQVVATLSPDGWDAALYILDGCASGAVCLDGRNMLGTGAETVAADAQLAGTWFIFVDSSASATSGTYTLEVELTHP